MEEGLKLKISADLSNAISALREMQREVNKTGQTAAGLGKSVGNAAAKMPNLEKSTGQATYALTNLGRVASDAPFGLIAIANNIDPLIQSFAQLKASSKESGGMLKALGASLMGGGGVIIAVSLLTSAMSFLSVGFDRWIGSSKKAKEEAKEFNDEVSNIGKKLSTEFQQVGAIVSLVQNYNLSKNEQVAAIKKLNEIAPEYFGNIKTEKDLVEKLSAAYFLYTNALTNVFRAKVKEKELSKVSEQLLKVEEQILKIEEISTRTGAQKGSIRLQTEGGGVQTIVTLYKARFELQQKFNRLSTEINGLTLSQVRKEVEKTKTKEKETQILDAQNGVIVGMVQNVELLNKKEEERLQIQKDLLRLQMQQPQLKGSDNLTSLDQFNLKGLTGDKTKSSVEQLFLLSGEVKKLNKEFELTDELINTVGNEFANLFTNISKDGTKAFEDFAKAVAETTTRILINYAVTQALKTLLNSLAPGAGMALDTKIGGEAVAGLTGTLRGSDISLSGLRALQI